MKSRFLLAFAAIVSFCPPRAAAVATPTLLAPGSPGGATKYVLCPSFTWSPVTGALNYEVQIAENPDFSSLVVSPAPVVKIARYVHPTPLLLTNGTRTLYWRVIAHDATSAAMSATFQVTLAHPGQVHSYTVPLNGTDDQNKPTYLMADVRATIATALANLPAEIVFPVDPLEPTRPLRVDPGDNECLIDIDPAAGNVSGLVIRGDATDTTRIVLTNVRSAFAIVRSHGSDQSAQNTCDSITLRDFMVDYDPHPAAWGVVASNSGGSTPVIQLTLGAGSPGFVNGWLETTDNATKLVYVLDSDRPTWLKRGLRSDYTIGSDASSGGCNPPRTAPYIAQSGNTVTLTMASSRANDIAAGDLLIYNFEYKPLIDIEKASDVTCYNITNYAAVGATYKLLWGKDLNVLNCHLVQGSLTGGTCPFGPAVDGVHAQACLNGPWVENCTFQGLGDDAFAYYQSGSRLIDFVASDSTTFPDYSGPTVAFASPHSLFATGDEIVVYDPLTGTLPVNGHVCRATWIAGNSPGNSRAYAVTRITLPAGYDPGTLGVDGCGRALATNPAAYSLTRNNANFYARHNTIDGNRGKAFIMRCNDAVIADNTIKGASRAAVVFQNEPEYNNGLHSWNVTIEGNTIEDCGFEKWPTEMLGNITVRFQGRDNANVNFISPSFCVAQLTLASNTVTNWTERAISVQNADGFTLFDNTVASSITNPPALETSEGACYGMFVGTARNGAIQQNDFSGDTRSYDAPVRLDSDIVSASNIERSDNLFVPYRLYDQYYYRLKSALSTGKCLSVQGALAEDAPVVLAPNNTADDSQLWLLTKNGASWNFTNILSQKAPRPSGGVSVLGTPVQQHTINTGWTSEKWSIPAVTGTNFHNLVSALGSPNNPAARLQGGATADGTPLVLDAPATAAYGSARWIFDVRGF